MSTKGWIIYFAIMLTAAVLLVLLIASLVRDARRKRAEKAEAPRRAEREFFMAAVNTSKEIARKNIQSIRESRSRDYDEGLRVDYYEPSGPYWELAVRYEQQFFEEFIHSKFEDHRAVILKWVPKIVNELVMIDEFYFQPIDVTDEHDLSLAINMIRKYDMPDYLIPFSVKYMDEAKKRIKGF